jgi:NTE family protein
MRKISPIFIAIIFIHFWAPAQKIGLVLSGGGADALAHIGVIKALEEHNIPIDYITGTSMGAMIGALYASGIPIDRIEKYFVSQDFLKISTGEIPEEFHYFYPYPDPSPSMISFRFKKSQKGYSVLLPSKVISSESFDFEAVKFLAEAEKLAHYNFDSLMIPFRCVAADLVTKELVVFKNGSLTEALRASMSYPFFVRPIKINGHLMYDGGIYNNFPVDIMCSDFKPDYIIGSNVSQNIEEPDDDDLLGQLQNILIKPTDYSIYCSDGELIEPSTNFGVFNFSNAQTAIDSGYFTTLRHIEHIKYHVASIKSDSTHNNELSNKFHNKTNDIIIGNITFKGINQKQATYGGSVLQRKKKKKNEINLKTFERNYYRLFQESYIEDIRTTLNYNPQTGKYDATVIVEPIKSLTLDLGGNIASRPITTGYAGFSYNNLSTFGFKFGLNTHFGKMYQALNIFTRFDIPSKLPFYIMPKFVTHRWNWFDSRQSNLFVTEKPNYILEGETYMGFELGTAIGSHLKLTGEIEYLQMLSDYYQTKTFSPSDTTDNTVFNALNTKVTISSNNLNSKQYPYSGNSFLAQATYTSGNEFYNPGSTSPTYEDVRTPHSFLQIKFDYQQYFRLDSKVRAGITLSGAYSGMAFFKNYTSTIIHSPSFKPTPDSKTLFLESFHANKYIGIGGQVVILPAKNFQVRAEFYVFQPYRAYKINDEGQVAFGTPFADRFSIVSAVASYQTPFGPLSFSANYYYNEPSVSPENEVPITLLVNFGYIIFNTSAYHH